MCRCLCSRLFVGPNFLDNIFGEPIAVSNNDFKVGANIVGAYIVDNMLKNVCVCVCVCVCLCSCPFAGANILDNISDEPVAVSNNHLEVGANIVDNTSGAYICSVCVCVCVCACVCVFVFVSVSVSAHALTSSQIFCSFPKINSSFRPQRHRNFLSPFLVACATLPSTSPSSKILSMILCLHSSE